MFELTRKVLSGTVLAAITGGVLLWGLSPGMTLKREYESYNGKPAGSEHTLQAITVPAYANVRGVTALEACTLQDGILVLAYPTCPYCRNLMPELLDAAEATDTSLYYCTLDKYRDVYTYDAAAGVPVLTTRQEKATRNCWCGWTSIRWITRSQIPKEMRCLLVKSVSARRQSCKYGTAFLHPRGS